MTIIKQVSAEALDERGALVKKVWSLNVTVRVTGRTTRKEQTRDETIDGRDRERDYEVTERIENTRQFAAAKKLETRIRGLADKFAVYVDGFGHLCSGEAKDRFTVEFDQLVNGDVRLHNEEHNQTAVVTAKRVTLELGMTFGASDISGILDHVAGELSAARDNLAKGDHDAVTSWLKRSQRLAGLFPSLNETVVARAIDTLREAKNVIAARAREQLGNEAYQNARHGPLPEHALANALNCVEWDTAVEAVESALGWLVPGNANAFKASGI